mmetsp:Transcript_131117/g.355925  ORF Transcript_131117/g.355925 Transcript_131117/m.355925 type:complete len:641 (+) Transcript_131117:94-2016(+)
MAALTASAPPTPGHGPVDRARRPSGRGWQLVEVSAGQASSVLSKSRSVPVSPNIPLLRSPSTGPALPPGQPDVGAAWGGRRPSGAREAAASASPLVAYAPPPRVGGRWADLVPSQRGTPTMPLLPPPAEGLGREEWPLPGAGAPAAASWRGAGTGAPVEDGGDLGQRAQDEPFNPEDFRPEYFSGDWLDNLGHQISVMPLEQRGGGRRGRRDRDGGRKKEPERVAFLAVLSKPGVPDKRFTIAKDRSRKEWTCGNGTLMREESGVEVLHWQAGDGRVSTWSREGCVYFDAPPGEQGMPEGGMMADQHQSWTMPMIFTLVPSEAGAPMGWQEQSIKDTVMDTDSVLEAMQLPRPALPVLPEAESAEGTTMRASAPEFVPTTFAAARASLGQAAEVSDAASSDGDGAANSAPSTGVPVTPQQRYARTPTQSPLLGPQLAPPQTVPPYRSRASPKMGPAPSHARGSADLAHRPQRGRTPAGTPQCSPQLNPLTSPPMPPTGQTAPPSGIELSEGAEDVQAFGSRLEWAIPDAWGKLSKLPQDFSVTSSMFGIKHCPNMQLAFYPNGNRAAEPGHCTVALTRGPQCAGIKFEFLVNGRGIGPKVCLGRRYLGDYPKPYDDSDASKPQKVVVCMQILEVLGTPAD